MKNKTALYGAIAFLVVVLIGGFVVVRGMGKKAPTPIEEEEEMVDLPPADPSIMVDLTPKKDGKAVVLAVSKIPSDTLSIEYELSYTTGEGLPKGALGKIDLNGKTEIDREILLGTCSRNTCTYDTGVTSVKLVLRFNTAEGATQFSKEYSLE